MSNLYRPALWASAALASLLTLQGCALQQPLQQLGQKIAQPSTTTTTAAAANSPQEQARQRLAARYPETFIAGDYVDSTEFKGVWAIRNPNPTLPRYFSDNIEWLINAPEPFGFMITTQDLTKEKFNAMRKDLAYQIDLTPWTLVKGKTAPKVVVVSAWDCPYSRQMELDLRKAGISYYLIPTGLSESSQALAAKIYGTPEFQKHWLQLLTQGKMNGKHGAQSRLYPAQAATDIHFIFKTASGLMTPTPKTPLFIMTDGRSGEGWNKKNMLPLIQKSKGQF